MAQNKLLLVDANIISHALTPSQRSAYEDLFETLEKDYKSAVTGLTKYEILRSSDKAHRDEIENFIEQNMVYIELSRTLMDFAARVCLLYGKHASTKGSKISIGDIVNAAFCIAKPCGLLTIDNNDYPTPFFQEVDRIRVEYKSKKGNDMIDTVNVLKPDLKNIKQCFDEHSI